MAEGHFNPSHRSNPSGLISLDYEETLSIMGDITSLVIEVLKNKYGERFLQDLCARNLLFPLAGTAFMLSRVEPPPCDDLINMLEGITRSPNYSSLSLTKDCEVDARNMLTHVLAHVKEICEKKDSKKALEYLSKEALKIEYLDDIENEIILNVLAFIPQLLYYAKEQGIDVSKDVINAHMHITNFLIKEINDIGERCRNAKSG